MNHHKHKQELLLRAHDQNISERDPETQRAQSPNRENVGIIRYKATMRGYMGIPLLDIPTPTLH